MKHLNTLLTAIYSSLLSLLGFGCSSSDPEDIICMYGMPTGRFEIKGSVYDEAGNDIQNAEIRVTAPDAASGIYRIGETATDAKGNYEVNGHAMLPEMKVVCIPEDKSLQPDSVIVKMAYKDSDKNDAWDRGHAEATVDFTLKYKSKTE